MKSFLGMVFLYFLFTLLLIGLGIVTGSLLRVVFPSVDRAMSILIGEVASVASIYLLARLMVSLPPIGMIDRDEDEDEDDEDEDEDDEEEEGPPPVRPPIWTPPPERPSWKRRRRRR